MKVICSICQMEFESRSYKRDNRVCTNITCKKDRKKQLNHTRPSKRHAFKTLVECIICGIDFHTRSNNRKNLVCTQVTCRQRRKQILNNRYGKPKRSDYDDPDIEVANMRYYEALLEYGKKHPSK